jgi:hypothetical protein
MRLSWALLASALLLRPGVGGANPVPFAQGWMLMTEASRTYQNGEVVYSPWRGSALGAGYTGIRADDKSKRRQIVYATYNYLLKRWNLTNAQANVFVEGGVGGANGNFSGDRVVAHFGTQVDYETRRVYLAWKEHLWHASNFDHRVSTVHLGWAPYAADYEELATWFVIQVRRIDGGILDTDVMPFVRLFKKNKWFEFGGNDGGLQVNFMMTF